jgi:glycosyltransferase involved in cell wall biosynthesis
VHGKSNIVAEYIDSKRRTRISQYSTIQAGITKEAIDSFYGNIDSSILINCPYDDYCFNREKFPQVPHKTISLIQVASYSSIKNQLFTIEVLYEIKKLYKDAKLTLVGFPVEDGYLEKIKDRIVELGLEENVVFMPSDVDRATLLNESTAFVFPSIREGFGIVLVEAQAMGVRCYASDSIPQHANCGGVQFLNLSAGAKVWANVIIEDYNKYAGSPGDFDISAFSAENVMRVYQRLYQGEQS